MQSQDPEAFNRVYNKIYLEMAQKDFTGAVKAADSLYSISTTPLFKAKSLMLSASLYQQTSDLNVAVNFARRAAEELTDSSEFGWKARIYGLLATQSRILGLYMQSKHYIDKATHELEFVNDAAAVRPVMGFVMQENAYYEINRKNYNKALEYLERSQVYVDLNPANRDFITANNEQLSGLCYFHLNNDEQAGRHYSNALKRLAAIPDNFITGLCYAGLAQIAVRQKKPEEAKRYLDKAQPIAEKTSFLQLKYEVNKISADYYLLTKDVETFSGIKKEQDSISDEIAAKSMSFVDKSVDVIRTENEQTKKELKHKDFYLLLTLLTIAGLSAVFLIYRKRKKQTIRRMKEVLEWADAKKISNTTLADTAACLQQHSEKLTMEIPAADLNRMPNPAEEKILARLSEFERSVLFTQKGITLAWLAVHCETNIKYLSAVINQYKKKDFNNYINELRVRYIIDKLRSSELYQKYKIAALADEAGFSSQSKFAACFKKVTSFSPSVFLSNLKSADEMSDGQ